MHLFKQICRGKLFRFDSSKMKAIINSNSIFFFSSLRKMLFAIVFKLKNYMLPKVLSMSKENQIVLL